MSPGDVAEVIPAVAQDRWAASAVNRFAGAALEEFASQVSAEGFASAFVDADGSVLWCAASPSVARAAERSGFYVGSNWSESITGTNGPGTALAIGQPVAVFANEHWQPSVQDWVCYAAPVRNRFGEVIGALDISTDWQHESGLALATVTAMSRVVEQLISVAPITSDSVRVRVLGHPTTSLYGEPIRLSLRQLEIVVILATVGPCTLGELHDHLYGERPVSTNTTKSEISGLRRLFGPRTIGSRPYHLDMPLDLDVVHLANAISRNDLETACRLYRGQLLPSSESPKVSRLRRRLDVQLRKALIVNGSAAQLRRYHHVHPFDDEVAELIDRRSQESAIA